VKEQNTAAADWRLQSAGMLVLATDRFTYLRDTPVPYSSAPIVLSVAASISDGFFSNDGLL
jgi:hypothetical protein